MALSIVEVEYVTTSCEVVWLRKLLSDLFDLQLDATCIHYDNQSCMKLLENPCSMTSQCIPRSSLYQGYGAEGSNEAPVCCDGGIDSRCIDEAIG